MPRYYFLTCRGPSIQWLNALRISHRKLRKQMNQTQSTSESNAGHTWELFIRMDLVKGKVSLFKALWLKWRSLKNIPFRKKFFIGYDLNGNTYWEFYLENPNERRRRIVEYRDPAPHYINSATSKDLPPQCMMWLRRTRPDFPTLTELANDVARQERMKILAKQADERWRKGSLLQNPGLTSEQQERLKLIVSPLHSKPATKNESQAELEPEKTYNSENPIETASVKPRR